MKHPAAYTGISAAFLIGAAAWSPILRHRGQGPAPGVSATVRVFAARSTDAPGRPSACAVALAPEPGTDPLDREIARRQREAQAAADPRRALERLGWLYVQKARLRYDPGYYRLAEQAGACMESRSLGDPDALLLRGHALDSLHRFREAEALARKLTAVREVPFDYGLLGDVLMEQGRLREAVAAYQKMVDLRPDLQSYSRVAHMRWLTGDLAGARAVIRMAARSGSPQEAESTAWACTRMALYDLQAGDPSSAERAVRAALSYVEEYAPALLALGRIRMAQGRSGEAVAPLRRAAALNPLPEYQWALAEALRAAGRAAEGRDVEDGIVRRGAATDPRTLALYLATRGRQLPEAVRLAKAELGTRRDVFTFDAVAWSQAAAGQLDAATPAMKRALAEGTQDARLFYHAGVIAERSGREKEAKRWLARARSIRQMLLPSERDDLDHRLSQIRTAAAGARSAGTG